MLKADADSDLSLLHFDFRIGDDWHGGEVVELDDESVTVRLDLSGFELRLPIDTPRRQPQQ